jgi:cell division transport system permease protein
MSGYEGDEARALFRIWRPGRSTLREHVLPVFSLCVAFVCLAASLLMLTNLAAVRERWSHAGRATVYLRENASEADTSALERALQATPGVAKVRVTSSLEARRELLTAGGEEATLASLPAAAFPVSIEVAFAESLGEAEVAQIAHKLEALPSVELVETYKRWTERLSVLLSAGVAAASCLALVVLAAVVSVVGSTMRLLLHSRRIEVEVLRLVGATDGFVRRPFVLEAAAQGAAGAGAALLLLGALFQLVRGRLDGELVTLLGVAPSFLPWSLSLGMIALGALLGGVTATLSLRKLLAL